MEIILLKDVENLGFADDIVKVKNGYGRNYLIPQGYAILATPSAKKVLQEKLKQRAFKEKHIVEEAQKLAQKLKSLQIKIPAKTGASGKLFGSINNQNLAEVLANEGFKIEKKFITVVGGNIKRLGKYQAKIRLHRDVIVDLEFEVVPIKEEKTTTPTETTNQKEEKTESAE